MDVLDIVTLYQQFLPLYADAARDQIYRRFADAIKSALNHFWIPKKEAAQRVQIVVSHLRLFLCFCPFYLYHSPFTSRTSAAELPTSGQHQN